MMRVDQQNAVKEDTNDAKINGGQRNELLYFWTVRQETMAA